LRNGSGEMGSLCVPFNSEEQWAGPTGSRNLARDLRQVAEWLITAASKDGGERIAEAVIFAMHHVAHSHTLDSLYDAGIYVDQYVSEAVGGEWVSA
jgi:hypothetical protein